MLIVYRYCVCTYLAVKLGLRRPRGWLAGQLLSQSSMRQAFNIAHANVALKRLRPASASRESHRRRRQCPTYPSSSLQAGKHAQGCCHSLPELVPTSVCLRVKPAYCLNCTMTSVYPFRRHSVKSCSVSSHTRSSSVSWK